MGKATAGEDRYPYSPLTEVVCELRFPGEIAVESARELFWDQIRDTYPAIKVQVAQVGTAPAMQHYRYCTEDGSRWIAVALNSLAMSVTQYTTHRPMLEEFKRVHELFRKCYPKLRRMNRVGWRYVNYIAFVRDAQGNAPVSEFFSTKLCAATSLVGSAVKNLNVRVESPTSEGLAIVMLATVHDAKDTTREAFSLDLDFAIETKDMDFADGPTKLAIARQANRQVFESMICERYRAFLRGETVE